MRGFLGLGILGFLGRRVLTDFAFLIFRGFLGRVS